MMEKDLIDSIIDRQEEIDNLNNAIQIDEEMIEKRKKENYDELMRYIVTDDDFKVMQEALFQARAYLGNVRKQQAQLVEEEAASIRQAKLELRNEKLQEVVRIVRHLKEYKPSNYLDMLPSERESFDKAFSLLTQMYFTIHERPFDDFFYKAHFDIGEYVEKLIKICPQYLDIAKFRGLVELVTSTEAWVENSHSENDFLKRLEEEKRYRKNFKEALYALADYGDNVNEDFYTKYMQKAQEENLEILKRLEEIKEKIEKCV